jgi:peroxiredoxin
MAISELADLSIDNIPFRTSNNARYVPSVHPRDPDLKVEFVFREKDENGDFQFVTRTAEEIFKGKRLAIFGLPGAFTPTRSELQLPAYELAYDDFIAKGIDEVYCVSVNDAFVMNAWFEKLGITKVKALPDGNGIFTWCCDLMVSKNNLGFGNRSWRYAAIVDDGVFEQCLEEAGKSANCESDPYENSTPQRLLATLG